MIETWLDIVMGNFWRSFVSFYQDNFWFLLVPIAAWMAVVFLGRRSISETEKALRKEMIDLGKDLLKLSPAQLIAQVSPQVLSVASSYKWMPSALGLWVKRADPKLLAQLSGLDESKIVRIRRDLLDELTANRRLAGV